MEIEPRWQQVTDHRFVLGEGPVWNAQRQCLHWVDILSGEVHTFDTLTSAHTVFCVGSFVGAVALRKDGGLLAAVQHGFAVVDASGGKVELIAEVEREFDDNRFNDGKCDPSGRFWAGTMSMSGEPDAGALYLLRGDGSVEQKIGGIGCSNGLAWSADRKTMYYIDTVTRSVVAYDYDDPSGAISNPRTVIRFGNDDGLPDGMTIDTEGMLWIALWGGWKVVRCDPASGVVLSAIDFPVAQVSSCTFGGARLDDLYITTAAVGLTEAERLSQPLAGALFAVRGCGYRGMEAVLFEG